MLIPLVLWLLALGVGVFVVYSHFIEPKRLELTRKHIHVPNLPPALEGLTIAHLTDLHIKSARHNFSYEISRQAVALTLAQEPSMVCITGDLGQSSRHLGRALEVLSPLAGLPVFVVMGNHDHDKMLESEAFGPPEVVLTAAEWQKRAEASGLTVLQNRHVVQAAGTACLVIAGVGDPSCGWDDLPRALHQVPAGDFHLLLVHSPDLLDDPQSDWADLVLCGHTHGGQITLPAIGCPWAPVWRDRARADGLIEVGQTRCFISRGVAAGIRTRFRCRPQVAILTLTAGEGDPPRRRRRFTRPTA